MPETDWSTWQACLTSELATLEEGEVLVFDHQVPPELQRWSEPRRGLFRSKPAQPLVSGLMAQFTGQGQDLLLGILEDATLVDGHTETTSEDDQRIRELGWQGPGDPAHYEPYAPNYTITDWPRSSAQELARVTLEALQLQGAAPSWQWTLTRR